MFGGDGRTDHFVFTVYVVVDAVASARTWMMPETLEGMSERLASGTACTSHSRPIAIRLPSGQR